MKRIHLLPTLLLVPWLVQGQTPTPAPKKPGDAVSVKNIDIKGEVRAGATVSVAAKFKLEKGYHVHSNKPSEKNFIATVLTLTAPTGVKVGEINYPAGKAYPVEGLDKPLSIYEDEFTLTVPVTLGADAVLPLTLTGSLGYQACQGARCYPPRKLKADITIGGTK